MLCLLGFVVPRKRVLMFVSVICEGFLMPDKVVLALISGATWNQHSKSSICSCIGAHRSLIGIERYVHKMHFVLLPAPTSRVMSKTMRMLSESDGLRDIRIRIYIFP